MTNGHDNNITGNYNLQNEKHSRLFFEFKTTEYHVSIFSLFPFHRENFADSCLNLTSLKSFFNQLSKDGPSFQLVNRLNEYRY